MTNSPRSGRWRLPRLSPAVRIGLGLASLVMALVLLLDIVFRVFPNPAQQDNQLRTRLAEQIALQALLLIEARQEDSLPRVLALGMSREASLARLRIERDDGRVVADRRVAGLPAGTTEDPALAFQVPLMTDGSAWGKVAVWFRDPPDRGIRELVRNPLVPMVLALGLACFAAFVFYLRRVLNHLDPSSVVPDRIRQAFDVFSGGIAVVDPKGTILLSNTRFAAIAGVPEDSDLTGRTLHGLPTLASALPAQRANHPWALAMDTGETFTGARLDITDAQGRRHRLLVNSAPIDDGDGAVRGCLVSFEDVTPIIELNEQLEHSNAELMRSQHEIEQMNAELVRLATRDPLTGAYNRRALFERLEALLSEARAQGTPMCCIMTDIDHFKQFNDRYGHAVGDDVLRAVCRVFTGVLRDRDVLARYGGEEFCILLPGVDLTVAGQVAERLREAIENSAGASVREPRGLRITSSFGVSAFDAARPEADRLIERADGALYTAKREGRNRVVIAPTATPGS